MKWSKARLALLIHLTFAVTAQAQFKPGGYERYTKRMQQSFEHGTKPPKDSIFAGNWQCDGWIYRFNIDGTMTITNSDGESANGKWVHGAITDGKGPTAIYRVKDHATAIWIKGETLFIDGGDTWIELKRVTKNVKEPKAADPQDNAKPTGAGQPAAKPTDKVPAEDQSSTPTSKDVPR